MFINRSHLLLDNSPQLNYGVAVTDIDSDGKFELVVAGFGFPNLVLKWDGDGFENVTPEALADANQRCIGVATGDIDGDGVEELYLLNTDTFGGPKRFGDRLFDFDGEEWVDLFALHMNKPVLNLTAGRSVICVDRMGTNIYGFYVANYGGPIRLYELDLDGRLYDAAPEAGLSKVTGGRGAVALPLVSEHMDIFAVNELGPNYLFRNKGDGTYEEVAAAFGMDDPGEAGRGVAVLDASDNGQFDVVYGNWEGPHRMYIRQGSRKFVDETPPEMRRPTAIRTVLAADFDNDGYQEIFFNNIGQANRLFARRRSDWFQVPMGDAVEERGLGTGAAYGDFDGDGMLELLIAHGESGMQPLALYSMPPNDNNFLRVLPRTKFGAPARGAVVKIKAGERIQIRVIDAGSGYLCQMEPVAHFGLGEVDAVEWIDIRWPDGKHTILSEPDLNITIDVPYPPF